MSMEAKTLGQCGDLALTTGKWRLQGTGADGKPVDMTGQSVEVARRQADGSWRYVIDAPWGHEWTQSEA
jgi:ketosteroid isomerase-like protein